MQLLDNAKWRNGAIWTAVMLALVAFWELRIQGIEPTPEWFVSRLMIWGVAGAGYAILTGWLATRKAAKSAPAVEAEVGERKFEGPSRAARRAAERAAMKAERRKR